MVTASFTGLGKSLRTGACTSDLFERRTEDILDDKKQARGYAIDSKKLKWALSLIVNGEMSLDEISWLWNEDNYIITANREVYHII